MQWKGLILEIREVSLNPDLLNSSWAEENLLSLSWVEEILLSFHE